MDSEIQMLFAAFKKQLDDNFKMQDQLNFEIDEFTKEIQATHVHRLELLDTTIQNLGRSFEDKLDQHYDQFSQKLTELECMLEKIKD